ncbi:MAG: response regulator [Lentisphaeria bacterium]|nr:response regulator [Lentisphaeria bacterium]NQZ70641.1 response regulator [Lentisphaeria bacterium]
MGQFHILLIDDNDIDRMMIKRTFRHLETKRPPIIYEARDGKEALEILSNEIVDKPFIILLDLNMSGMDGISFLKEVRSTPAFNSCVVFVVSTSSSEIDIKQLYELNIAGYFIKPKDPRELQDFAAMIQNYSELIVLPA